jgi:hypothetical protein
MSDGDFRRCVQRHAALFRALLMDAAARVHATPRRATDMKPRLGRSSLPFPSSFPEFRWYRRERQATTGTHVRSRRTLRAGSPCLQRPPDLYRRWLTTATASSASSHRPRAQTRSRAERDESNRRFCRSPTAISLPWWPCICPRRGSRRGNTPPHGLNPQPIPRQASPNPSPTTDTALAPVGRCALHASSWRGVLRIEAAAFSAAVV